MPAASEKSLGTELEENFRLILNSIKSYPDQVQQAWDEINGIQFPEDFKNVQNVVVSGMGGSALGARVVDSLMQDRIRVPIEIFNDYRLPNYVGPNTIVIAYSYSGNTEETISATNEALTRGAKIFGVTSGGKLQELLEKENLPRYILNPQYNPSKQPRMGLGYAIGTILSFLSTTGLVQISKEEIDEATAKMKEVIKDCDEGVVLSQNLAKSYAQKLYGKIPVLVASEHLSGVVYSIKNQLNESAKVFAVSFDLPELNHHLMEGLKNPEDNKKILYFVFFNSDLYSDRVRKRYPLTAEVVGKNEVSYSIYSAFSDRKISQVFSALVFGSFVTYYLTRQYGADPIEIPWVDYFKAKLASI